MFTSEILLAVLISSVQAEKLSLNESFFGTPVDFVIDFIEYFDIDNIIVLNDETKISRSIDTFVIHLYKIGKRVSVVDISEINYLDTSGKETILYLLLHLDPFAMFDKLNTTTYFNTKNIFLVNSNWDKRLQRMYFPIDSQVR